MLGWGCANVVVVTPVSRAGGRLHAVWWERVKGLHLGAALRLAVWACRAVAWPPRQGPGAQPRLASLTWRTLPTLPQGGEHSTIMLACLLGVDRWGAGGEVCQPSATATKCWLTGRGTTSTTTSTTTITTIVSETVLPRSVPRPQRGPLRARLEQSTLLLELDGRELGYQRHQGV